MQRRRMIIIYMGNQREPGACEIYRGNQPASMLNKYSKRWEANWLFFGDLVAMYTYAGQDAVISALDSYDLIVFPRMFIPNDDYANMRVTIARLFELLHEMGKRIIYETDDDYTNKYRYVVEGDAEEVVSWCDAVTVTTPLLGRAMTETAKRPFHVLPNCLDPFLWKNQHDKPAQSKNPGKVIIGLTGSPTHYRDWEILAEPFRRLADELGDRCEFWIAGFHPDYLKDLPNAEYVEAMHYTMYARMIRGCDIILAPVLPTDGFNLGKSPIKATEGMGAYRKLHGLAAGAAVIATRNPVYSLVIKHGESGLLTEHTSDGWYQAISRLVLDDAFRRQLQLRGFKQAWKNYDATVEFRQWERVYDRVMDMPRNTIYLPTLYGEKDAQP